MAYFYHPQLLNIFLVKADIKQLSPNFFLEVLMKIEGMQALSVSSGQFCPPPLHPLGLMLALH